MRKWIFWYYGCFGKGDCSEDIDFELEVSDEEYLFLKTVAAANDVLDEYEEYDIFEENEEMLELPEEFDYEQYLADNAELREVLEEKAESTAYEVDEELTEDLYDEDDDGPDITVRFPWD